MTAFNLLNNLEEGPKTKYQLFEAEMGFERVKVYIPVDRAEDFAVEALEKKPKSSASLSKLAQKHGGHLE